MNHNIEYVHYKHIFSEQEMKRFGSQYYSSKERGEALLELFSKCVKTPIFETNKDLEYDYLMCANEAFPEAALSDPFADLEVWSDWKSGFRSFPYAGTYAPLNIEKQETKTVSTSSIGVIGEILSGIYIQNIIAPHILLRNINRWPDFITINSGLKRFSFVESKATTATYEKENNAHQAIYYKNIPPNLLTEFFDKTNIQLNADPGLNIYGVFTLLKSIKPSFKYQCIIIEISAPDDLYTARRSLLLPDVVIKGVSDRAVQKTLLTSKYYNEIFEKPTKDKLKLIQEKLIEESCFNIEEVFTDSFGLGTFQILINDNKILFQDKIRQNIEKLVSDKRKIEIESAFSYSKVHGLSINSNMISISQKNDEYFDGQSIEINNHSFQKIRSIGGRSIYYSELTKEENDYLVSNWMQKVDIATKPFWDPSDENPPVYRCGGGLYCIK
jgi:hypothetical protein